MIDGIKERFQIAHRSAAEMTGAASPKGERSESIDDPFPSLLFRFPLHGLDRVVGTSCRTAESPGGRRDRRRKASPEG